MGVYAFTLLVLLVFSFLELRTNLSSVQHKTMLVFTFGLFVFQVGLRWQTGTDWEPYLMNFENTNSITDVYYSIDNFEKGYGFLVLLIKKLWNSYTAFLVIHALVYYVLVFSAFKKFSPYIFVSLLVFYATTMGVLGSNRQLIALGICLFSLRYVAQKETFKFFMLIGFAFLFHSSAVLFVVYYFLNRDIKKPWIVAILMLSFIIGKTSIPSLLFSFVGNSMGVMVGYKALVYVMDSKNDFGSLSVLGLVKRFLFLGLFIYNYDYLTAKLSYYKIIFNGYFVGLIIYFLFSSSILVIVNRGSLYFTVMEVLLLSAQFLLIKDRDYTVNFLILLFIVTIFLFYQSISGYADLFVPYKGIFINRDFDRFRID